MMLERLHVCVLPVILVVFYYVVPVGSPVLSDGYVSTCPTPSEIKERSLHHPCPKKKPYHIVWDPQHNKYKYGCFEFKWVPAGYVTILDNNTGYFNTKDCDEGTFQPDDYRSNTQCACKETKGHCNKTGQLIASNGNTTHDRTCRCDFKRGYKFSIKPSNECFGQSSSEDCTCIKEECKTGYRLSPDYECVHENSTTNYTCEDITSDDSITESVPGIDTSVSEESTTESVPDNDASIPERMPTGKLPGSVIAIIVLVVVIVIVVSCAAGVLLERKCGVYARMCACCKKSRPDRNGSAPTNNEGTEHVPVQVTESDVFIDLSKSAKLEDEFTYKQPLIDHSNLESVVTEMLSHTEVDESEDEVTNEQPPIEDNYSVNYTESDVFIHMSTSARPEDEVTYKQPLTDHSYLENDAVNEMSARLEVVEKPAPDEVTSKQPEPTHSYLTQ